ncbi:hypothetical protein [Streptomyces palmae]|uniref:Zinc ribbon domain-containing protein n=1 Tax=Streptomyces palmae TaxID=1701085 RepID=A0A4Z0GY68_9ACTN|nr:hypothetical protein [Streptomyces palmae]TGB01538.1 hypothetical protein E4099_21070 [Streptomyces palmae]
MASSNRPGGVLARTADLLREAPEEQGGAVWRLSTASRQLDSNLVRLAPGKQVAGHVEPDLDVLVYVTGGSGGLAVDGAAAQELVPGCVAWLPHGSHRSLAAGPDGLTYLTVHRRRPGMSIRSAPPRPAGGEPACLLDRVCPECGRLAEESGARFCSRCGERLPD